MSATSPLFDRLYLDAPPYGDETAATILDAVNARGAIVYEHATDRALLLRGEGRCERLGQGRYPGRSLAAMVALGLLRVDAHHDPEGVGTLTFYAGTGARVVALGGSLAAGDEEAPK